MWGIEGSSTAFEVVINNPEAEAHHIYILSLSLFVWKTIGPGRTLSQRQTNICTCACILTWDIIYLAATYPNVIIHYTRISFIKKMNEGIFEMTPPPLSLSRLANKSLLLWIVFYIGFILCPTNAHVSSPFAKRNYISSTCLSHEKTLKEMKEKVWRLGGKMMARDATREKERGEGSRERE